ncbi:MAG: shikimate kinase [Balneolaceae bacterium]
MITLTEKPILLCGMMGSGKTTIARILARRLNCPWSDLDRIIEKRKGRTIPELFDTEGETYFRQLEREELERVLNEPPSIIALGGGALQSQEVVNHVRNTGWLIFLDAPQSVLLERLGRKTGRPLTDSLNKDELRQKIDTLFAQREGFYRQAHITIPVGQLTPFEIAEQIEEQIDTMTR